jgi:hypothetical protein
MIDRELAWSRGVSAPGSGFDSIGVKAGCLDVDRGGRDAPCAGAHPRVRCNFRSII